MDSHDRDAVTSTLEYASNAWRETIAMVASDVATSQPRCDARIRTVAEVRQAFREQRIELRIVPTDQLDSLDPRHPKPLPGVYLIQRHQAYVSPAVFSTIRRAVTAQLRTPKRDPIVGTRLATLRCGNVVMLFSPDTRGEVIARRAVAVLR